MTRFSDAIHGTRRDIRFTTKGAAPYAIALGCPEGHAKRPVRREALG